MSLTHRYVMSQRGIPDGRDPNPECPGSLHYHGSGSWSDVSWKIYGCLICGVRIATVGGSAHGWNHVLPPGPASECGDTPGATPLPWRAGKLGTLVAELLPRNDMERYFGGRVVCDSISAADTELVLRAVHTHADLLAACKAALRFAGCPQHNGLRRGCLLCEAHRSVVSAIARGVAKSP